MQIDVQLLVDNPFNERVFQSQEDKEGIKTLAEQMKRHGFLGALVARPRKDGKYEIAFGSRRIRAAALAGLETIEVTVKEMTDREMEEITVIENAQRVQVNEWDRMRHVLKFKKKHKVSGAETARIFSLDETLIANYNRIASLPPSLQKQLEEINANLRTVARVMSLAVTTPGSKHPEIDIKTAARLLKMQLKTKRINRGEIDGAVAAIQRLSANQRKQIIEQVITQKIQLKDVPDVARLQPGYALPKPKARVLSPDKLARQLRDAMKDANNAIAMAKNNWHHFNKAEQVALAMEIEMLHTQFIQTTQKTQQIQAPE